MCRSTPCQRNPIQEPGLLARLRLRVFGWAKRVGWTGWGTGRWGKRLHCLCDHNLELLSFPMFFFVHPRGVPKEDFWCNVFDHLGWCLGSFLHEHDDTNSDPWAKACKIPAMPLHSAGVRISCQCQLGCVRPCWKIALRSSQINIELHSIFHWTYTTRSSSLNATEKIASRHLCFRCESACCM